MGVTRATEALFPGMHDVEECEVRCVGAKMACPDRGKAVEGQLPV